MNGLLGKVDQDTLRQMSWDDLIRLRLQHPDPESQQLIAPYEHRAYAREQVAENPLMAPAFLAMTPAYQIMKLLGQGSRTPPSWQQLGYGLLGIGEGLEQRASQAR